MSLGPARLVGVSLGLNVLVVMAVAALLATDHCDTSLLGRIKLVFDFDWSSGIVIVAS